MSWLSRNRAKMVKLVFRNQHHMDEEQLNVGDCFAEQIVSSEIEGGEIEPQTGFETPVCIDQKLGFRITVGVESCRDSM